MSSFIAANATATIRAGRSNALLLAAAMELQYIDAAGGQLGFDLGCRVGQRRHRCAAGCSRWFSGIESLVPYRIEPLVARHCAGVLRVLNHHIARSFAAYRSAPGDEALFERYLELAENHPAYVVVDDDEGVVGFAFTHAYHAARGFARVAEVTYFLLPNHTRKGLGTELLELLVRDAKAAGVTSLLAQMSSLNHEGRRFHEQRGFRTCGTLEQVGEKFGQIFDVVWMQLPIISP